MSWTPNRGTPGHRCYPAASKLHCRQLVADARPDSAQKTRMPRPPISNPPLHSWALTSLRRPSRIASRLNSWGSSVRAASHCVAGVGRVASIRRPAEQVHERSHRRQQYHRTAPRTGRPVPRPWRHLRAGLAAMKIHLLWISLTGSILQLHITPGRQRRYPPDLPGARPGPSRCRCSTWPTSV